MGLSAIVFSLTRFCRMINLLAPSEDQLCRNFHPFAVSGYLQRTTRNLFESIRAILVELKGGRQILAAIVIGNFYMC